MEKEDRGNDYRPEIWGGVECTVNRVGNQYFNQLEWSGHWDHAADVEEFAKLGISAIRYPALWELTTRGASNKPDWSWVDERIGLLKACGMKPIIGFLHHGSGPDHTDLLDPSFPAAFARYAVQFAERYPWIEYYTPVNEPLTTARFSALYGFWYPHKKDQRCFVKALVHQCKAVALAMREVRTVNPNAKLVQTEDICTVYSSPMLAEQAQRENDMRWLSLDLLCGRIDPRHSFWDFMKEGASEEELDFFQTQCSKPDIIGVNYYITSDRFLDHRVSLYPKEYLQSYEKKYYVDTEAVRIPEAGIAGHLNILKKVWERYHTPIALTEVHIGSTREDQMRWLWEAWCGALEAGKQGVDVRAVTVWALLGSFDWNTLVTHPQGYYESGVYDVRSPRPRPTALAHMVRNLSDKGTYEHPVLHGSGWWRKRDNGPDAKHTKEELCICSMKKHISSSILITGGSGTLGRYFAQECILRGLSHCLLTRREMDIANPESVQEALERHKPWAVINTAGYVRVDDAEGNAEQCFRENTLGPEILARACRHLDVHFLTFSSDLVFDGAKQFYKETDPVAPLNIYGLSKAEAEERVLNQYAKSLIVRTSSFFGPMDEFNFLTQALRNWVKRIAIRVADDTTVTPTYVPDLVRACLDILIDGECGIWHITNYEPLTWADFAQRLAKIAGFSSNLVQPCSMEELKLVARRPKCSALLSHRGTLLPSLDQSLLRYRDDLKQGLFAGTGGKI